MAENIVRVNVRDDMDFEGSFCQFPDFIGLFDGMKKPRAL